MEYVASGSSFEPALTIAPGMEPYTPLLPGLATPRGEQPSALVVPASSLLGFDIHALSPDALMIYLDARLESLDTRIDAIFTRQQDNEKIRKALLEMQKILESLDENQDDPGEVIEMPGYDGDRPTEIEHSLHGQIRAIGEVDPELARAIEEDLTGQGQILYIENGKYKGSELRNTKDYLNSLGKQLESGAQLDMIQLQSLMSARQTAIQLATNLTAAYNDSQKAIVTNIR